MVVWKNVCGSFGEVGDLDGKDYCWVFVMSYL